MALNFPDNPTLNQVYTLGSKSWTWNNSGWAAVAPFPTGNQDYGLITGSATGTIDYGAIF